MICPQCRRPYFFLQNNRWDAARCLRCRHEGEADKPSYADYHQHLYGRKYRRTPQTDPQMRFILNQLQIKRTDIVVDLGCGVGDYTAQIANLTAHAAGYDLDVSEASKKYPGVRFFAQQLAQAVPLPDRSVDKLVSINVIEHLADPEFFLKECFRILKPGGTIAISTANREFMLHDLHYDETHLHEWKISEFKNLTEPYFKTVRLRKDCAAFNYYPLNFFLRLFLKPDMTLIAKKRFE